MSFLEESAREVVFVTDHRGSAASDSFDRVFLGIRNLILVKAFQSMSKCLLTNRCLGCIVNKFEQISECSK